MQWKIKAASIKREKGKNEGLCREDKGTKHGEKAARKKKKCGF